MQTGKDYGATSDGVTRERKRSGSSAVSIEMEKRYRFDVGIFD